MDGLKQVGLALATGGVLASGAAQAALNDRGGGLIYDDVLKVTWLANGNYAAEEFNAGGADARRNAIISAVNSANPAWLGAHAMSASDFSGSGSNYTGQMTWWGAMAWADQLSYRGYDDWRLPLVGGGLGCDSSSAYSGTDCGWNVRTADSSTTPVTVYSELAHMYYVGLGLKPAYNPDGSLRSDWGIFGNGTLNGTDSTTTGENVVGPIAHLRAWTYWTSTVYAPSPTSAWVFDIDSGQQSTDDRARATIFAWAVRPGDVAAPIPEPETYAMLLAGLGLLGVVARRRKQQSPV